MSKPTDRRIKEVGELSRIKAMLTAAVTSDQLVAYPVDFHGNVVTVLGFQRAEDEIVPLAMVLDDDEWGQAPHLTDTHGPVVQWRTN